MSYDLSFVSDEPLSADAFRRHFAKRAHTRARENAIGYQNDDTGVYFSFDFHGAGEPSHAEPRAWASFSLNYARPHFFALEAAGELAAFCRHFACQVCDPQADGQPQAFSAEDFIASYARSNRVVRANVEHSPQLARTEGELVRIWRWNFGLKSLQKSLGNDIFVPRVNFFQSGGEVFTASVWSDAIPIVLPKTERVLVYRNRIAPDRAPTYALASWPEVARLLDDSRRELEPLEHYYVESYGVLAPLELWQLSLSTVSDLTRIASERIAELP